MKILYNEVKQTVDLNKIKVFIVGNKNDQYENEQVKKDVAEKYAKSINGTYRCISALEGTGINELFDNIGRSFLKKEEKINSEESKEKNKPEKSEEKEFSLEPEFINKKNNKKKCC